MLNFDVKIRAPQPLRSDYGIGAVGAGFIMRDVQLVAYRDAGYRVAGITSNRPERAREVAELRGISRVYETLDEMLEDPGVEILDIAVPPDKQRGIIEKAVRQGHNLKGVLAQKPLAVNYREALEIVEVCEGHGLPLAVNQNMRYDQSIRALKARLRWLWSQKPQAAATAEGGSPLARSRRAALTRRSTR